LFLPLSPPTTLLPLIASFSAVDAANLGVDETS
jgi:hypothetical protein